MKDEEMYRLLKKSQQGDDRAFHLLYASIYQDVYRTVFLLVDSEKEREYVLKDIYIRLRQVKLVQENLPFRYWLHGMMIRELKKRKHHYKGFLFRFLSRKTTIFQYLSNQQRQIIVFRYYHHYSFPEIAELLAMPLKKVITYHRTALHALRFDTIEGDVEEKLCHDLHMRVEEIESSSPTLKKGCNTRVAMSANEKRDFKNPSSLNIAIALPTLILSAILISFFLMEWKPLPLVHAKKAEEEIHESASFLSEVQWDQCGKDIPNQSYDHISIEYKGKDPVNLQVLINPYTDELEGVMQEACMLLEADVMSMPDKQVNENIAVLIGDMYGSLEGYHSTIEKLRHPKQKTMLITYSHQDKAKPSFQVFLQGNKINVRLYKRFESKDGGALN
ncbi:sigma factor-like helix-turn-helix DNA-binding protein [Bacillus chungangensis]|uniref:DNA-directed RNA polymerase specialized sigma24 family protein n=1 Tax=Bacillus chungangensis TaxID=587633 RepID=A0ABT9WV68_9BACI|nr:sigma factor-like helix-turn-helix DNA-binding protein [Bacillus chungangensis]MDQ0176988.1 DNA-directed RNA polymerase specialized sigma24 family protein [Bacillus chungangensis]